MTCYFSIRYLTTNSKYKISYFVILWLFVFSEVTLANISESSYLVDSGLPILTIIIFCFYFTKGSLTVKILIPIFSYILLFACNMTTLSIMSIFSGYSLNDLVVSKLFPYAIILSKIFYFITVIVILKFRKRVLYGLNNDWLIFVPICVMSIVVLINLSELLFTGIIDYNLLYISLFSLLGFCIFLYFFFVKLQKDSENSTRQLLEIQQLRYQKENMNDIKLMNEEIRKIKHDMKHKLDFIKECIKNDNKAEIYSLLDNTYNELNNFNVVQWSDNETLNYILQSKNKYATQKQVRLSCEIVFYKQNIIENEDLIVLLGNLLDNAIENSLKGKSVTLFMNIDRNYLHIKVSNEVLNQIDISKTSKPDKHNHGFGLKSIKSIVEKYNGDIKQYYNNNQFITDILLPINRLF